MRGTCFQWIHFMSKTRLSVRRVFLRREHKESPIVKHASQRPRDGQLLGHGDGTHFNCLAVQLPFSTDDSHLHLCFTKHHTTHTPHTYTEHKRRNKKQKHLIRRLIAMSFSFSHIPIGLGLATAAHIHLCRKNLAHAERLRQRHQDQNLTVQTLSDMVVLTEVIGLLDGTIDSISTMHPKQRSRRTQNSKTYQCKEKPSKPKINGSNEMAARQSAPSPLIPLELSAGVLNL